MAAPTAKPPHRPDRFDRLHKKYPHLDPRVIVFLAALEQFLDAWPDRKVVREFEVSHGLAQDISQLKEGAKFVFELTRDSTKIKYAVQRLPEETKETVTRQGPVLSCWCFDPYQGICALIDVCPCPIPC